MSENSVCPSDEYRVNVHDDHIPMIFSFCIDTRPFLPKRRGGGGTQQRIRFGVEPLLSKWNRPWGFFLKKRVRYDIALATPVKFIEAI